MATATYAPTDTFTSETCSAENTLDRNLFVVKEHVGFFKAASNYDVLDAETGQVILHCREPHLGMFTKLFRFTKYKRMTPFDVRITTPDGQPILRVTRGISLFLSNVRVQDESEQFIGSFKQKLFSLGGKFSVLNQQDEAVCELKGKWTGWDFQFHTNGQELARVTKKWAGIGKELFTSADTYVLSINDSVPPASSLRKLIMAAVMTIDLVLKE